MYLGKIILNFLPPSSLNADPRKSREQMKKYRLAKIRTRRRMVHTTRRSLPFVSKSTKKISTELQSVFRTFSTVYVFIVSSMFFSVKRTECTHRYTNLSCSLSCYLPSQGIPVSLSSGHAHGSSGGVIVASFCKILHVYKFHRH